MSPQILKRDRRRYFLISFLVLSLILLESSAVHSAPILASGYGGVPVPEICAPGQATTSNGFPCIQPAPPDPTPNPFNPIGIPPIPAPVFPPLPPPIKPCSRGTWEYTWLGVGGPPWGGMTGDRTVMGSSSSPPVPISIDEMWYTKTDLATGAPMFFNNGSNSVQITPISFKCLLSPDSPVEPYTPPSPAPGGGGTPAPGGGGTPAPGGGGTPPPGGTTPPPGGTTPSPAPTPPPGQNPDKPEQYKQIKPNFIQYAFDQLKGRFPFDVFGDTALPAGSSACPKFTFFGKTFELCIILDFIKILKIPCVISFIIWSIQSL